MRHLTTKFQRLWRQKQAQRYLSTKFQRLWRQKQAQRYLSSKNRVFHVYDSPTLAWLAMLVFAIVQLFQLFILCQINCWCNIVYTSHPEGYQILRYNVQKRQFLVIFVLFFEFQAHALVIAIF